MRKFFSIISILMLLPLGLGLNVPLPIGVNVNGFNTEVDVGIKNLRTGESVVVRTEDYSFVYDWLNSPEFYGGNKFENGDTFELKVLICDNSPNCVKTAQFSGGRIIVNFDLTEQNLPCPECDACEVCEECFDCDPCICEPCETCKTCEVCQVCEECEVCPEITFGTVLSYILTLLGGLGAGAGVQYTISKSKDGKVTMKATKHKHEGIEGFHSIYTMHSNDNIVHPKGCVKPVYENGKFKECGDK